MTLIDLGDLRDAERPEPPARRPRPPANRLPGFLAVLLLALLTLAAATPPPGRVAVVVPARLGVDRLVAGNLLLVVDPPSRERTPRSMAAYRLPGGEPAWRAPLPVDGRFWGVSARADDLLLISGYEVPPEGRGTVTVALDAATGAYRWQQPGAALGVSGGGLLLEDFSREGRGTLRAVDPCCGTPRWTADVPAGEVGYRFTPDGMDRVLLSDPRGRVEVRDAVTGAVLVAADLWSTAERPYRSTQMVGDLLVTIGGTPPVMTAYGVDRLDRRWRAPVPDASLVLDCGGVICGQTRSGTLWAVDPATGRPLWTRPGWDTMWAAPGRLVVVRVPGTGTGPADLAVLDPVTGRVRAELGRWEFAQQEPGHGRLLAVRPHPAGGPLVAEIDAAAAIVRVLDVLPEASGDCHAIVGGVLCRRPDSSIGLWRLRR
ncbi:PQQ-binding-like beta-propeller repeat protein [Micromonospora sp. WMMC415]|uniref:outer membrane protein assembly factor BamB family protein n=1 Tax=Micromonospora sp. WMMC415 TaxID=2675222 RepID=UPI0012B48B0A|nr:PQQ-binding-like beta-propeller repeat protein [Micromonospora sp. WMMC415]QGN50039.1 PQQ-binding-like beta-propeller repeat protein [Micromonospora sp. WMMC415]